MANSINAPKVSPSQAAQLLLAHATSQLSSDKRQLPIFLWGIYAAAKSSIVRQAMEKLSKTLDRPIGLIDVRLSQFDAVDTRGVPYIRDQHDALDMAGDDALKAVGLGPRKITEWSTPAWLPDVERDGPEGCLFLDELMLASASTQ